MKKKTSTPTLNFFFFNILTLGKKHVNEHFWRPYFSQEKSPCSKAIASCIKLSGGGGKPWLLVTFPPINTNEVVFDLLFFKILFLEIY
jgi:hypothetical protein